MMPSADNKYKNQKPNNHLQAMITCQSPALASAAAAFRPRPDDAPVITTVGFRLVNLLLVDAAAGACTLSAVEAARHTTREACKGENKAKVAHRSDKAEGAATK
jgi:hypothetical protein